MGWKQTLILGGAVLLLAACDRATAPIANVREGGAAVSVKAPTDSTTNTMPTVGPTSIEPTSCSGIVINIGNSSDSTCVTLEF